MIKKSRYYYCYHWEMCTSSVAPMALDAATAMAALVEPEPTWPRTNNKLHRLFHDDDIYHMMWTTEAHHASTDRNSII